MALMVTDGNGRTLVAPESFVAEIRCLAQCLSGDQFGAVLARVYVEHEPNTLEFWHAYIEALRAEVRH